MVVVAVRENIHEEKNNLFSPSRLDCLVLLPISHLFDWSLQPPRFASYSIIEIDDVT